MSGSTDGEIAVPARRRLPALPSLRPRPIPLDTFPRRAAWPVALTAAALAVALGAPLVVQTATGDELRHPETAAAFRGAWIGLYAAIGLFLARRERHWPLGVTMTVLALVGAVASLDALPGAAAYTVSRVVILALVPLSVLMLMAFPEARAVCGRLAGLVALAVPLALALAAVYLMLATTAPWNQVASQCRGECAGSAIQLADAPAAARAVLVLMVGVLVATIVALIVILIRAIRVGTPVTRRTLTPLAWLICVWGLPVAAGLVAVAIRPAPDRLNPYLVASGVIRAALPVALLMVIVAQALRTSAISGEVAARLAAARDPADVERTMAEALRDPSLRLTFRDGPGWIDIEGRPVDVEAGGGGRGWIAMSLDGADDAAGAVTFDPALHTQEERIQAIAALGATALERARTEAELRAMRRRLVSAAEDERRRLERNLHDGAQQRLVTMAVHMAMARDALATRPEVAMALLGDLGAEVQQALDELRALSHGLYPPVLTDHGLPGALRAAARQCPRPVETGIAEIGRLDATHEEAVYFTCAEALQNAVKHGGADPGISLALWRDPDGAVRFEVADRGPGFAVGHAPPGSGLMGMRDRVEDVGGSLEVASEPGRGTTVRGRVPQPAPAGG